MELIDMLTNLGAVGGTAIGMMFLFTRYLHSRDKIEHEIHQETVNALRETAKAVGQVEASLRRMNGHSKGT